jgi:hypothetical protein
MLGLHRLHETHPNGLNQHQNRYTLRGWAKLDIAAGESAIQSNVTWDIENYTDATARQYLIDTYHWMICFCISYRKVGNGVIACVFKAVIKDIYTI